MRLPAEQTHPTHRSSSSTVACISCICRVKRGSHGKPQKKNFTAPDERRTPPNTEMDTVQFGNRKVTRITYHPGWRWTNDIKPTAGTDLCQVNHFVYVLSGQTHVVMADGTEIIQAR